MNKIHNILDIVMLAVLASALILVSIRPKVGFTLTGISFVYWTVNAYLHLRKEKP